MHGSKLPSSSPFRYSTWLSIIREIHSLKDRGVDLVSHCRIHVGNGLRTNFWKEVWIGDNPLCVLFPRIFALETNKDSSVAVKLSSVTSSLRRPVRGGSESVRKLSLIKSTIVGTILHRWRIGHGHRIGCLPVVEYCMGRRLIKFHDQQQNLYREPHLAALKRILRYVQGTLELGLHLYAFTTTSLVGYTDADWADCPSTRRSTSGYCVFLGDNLLSW
ncbi:RNA-directed DNA polymerase, eukaryota [Tanacetum coccineum]